MMRENYFQIINLSFNNDSACVDWRLKHTDATEVFCFFVIYKKNTFCQFVILLYNLSYTGTFIVYFKSLFIILFLEVW